MPPIEIITRCARSSIDEEEERAPVPATRPETPNARRADATADLPADARPGQASRELLAFVSSFASTQRATVIDAARAVAASPSVQVAKRLDALRDAYSGPYTVTENGRTETVRAPAMFRMNGGANQAAVKAGYAKVAAIARTIPLKPGELEAAQAGRPSPETIRKLTQAMIDHGLLPSGPDLPSRIKTMQWQYGIGIDCAGYTYRAICAATGKSPKELNLLPPGTEAFRQVEGKGTFRSVATAKDPSGLATLEPGDIVTLDGPKNSREPGHNVIVRSVRTLDESGRAALVSRGGDETAFFGGAGPFLVIEVDSSWGAGPNGSTDGGVRRDTWFYDESTKRWGSTAGSPKRFFIGEKGPAGDDFHGAYRAKGAS